MVPGKVAPRTAHTSTHDSAPHVGLWELFVIFFKSSLAFGGGLGIVAIMEDELVGRRKLVTREEFLTIYAMGRIVPSGTMTALAVAYGYRFRGFLGTVVALVALVLPAFVLTVVLTAAYQLLAHGPVLAVLPVTLLPAALALIVTAALRLGQDIYRPSVELLLALLALGAVLLLHVHPSLMLIAGGAYGAVGLKPRLQRLPSAGPLRESVAGDAAGAAHQAHDAETAAHGVSR